jgi:hypothetical protein
LFLEVVPFAREKSKNSSYCLCVDACCAVSYEGRCAFQSLSFSLSLCFQKEANSELFFPSTQNNIFATEYIDTSRTGEKRETRKSLLSCVIKEIKIFSLQTKNKQKKIFRFWMEAE